MRSGVADATPDFFVDARRVKAFPCLSQRERQDGDVKDAVPYTFYSTTIEFVGADAHIRPWDDVGSEATRAAMNDSPVDCQNREWTEPQRDDRPLHFRAILV